MRNTLLLLFIVAFQAYADDTFSQNTKLSLNATNVSVANILEEIENKSDFYFLYNAKLIESERKVSISVEEKKISEILATIFSGTGINYVVYNKQIILVPGNSAGLSEALQQLKITGTVADKAGNPLPGVNVIVTGTAIGTVTDASGKYSIDVQGSSRSLTFRFVGMETQEITIANRTVIDVVMEDQMIGLNEVVVTALGIKREEKALGYAVQKVGGETLQKVVGTEVGTSLTGKVAGVLVQNPTDFNVQPTIQVRGENPLIVIDGVAYANKKINDLAAEDIESLEVLKGASASALYGFRGQNGAILITTKNGNTEKMGVTVNAISNTLFSAGFLAIPEKQSVYGRGSANIYDINSDNSWGTFMDGTVRTQWDPKAKVFRDYEYLPVGKNNFKNFLEPGYVTTNSLNVAFRNKQVALRSSLVFVENKGQYPNSRLNKYTYTLGADINLDKFKLVSNMAYSKRYSPNMGSNGYTSYDPMYTLLIWSSADFNILDYKNNYWIKPGEIQNNHFGYNLTNNSYSGKNQNNPYFDRWERINEVSRDIFNADLTTSYNITDWLTVMLRTGIDFYIDRGELRISKGSYTSAGNTGIPGIPYPWGESTKGSYMVGQTMGYSINSDFLLTGKKTLIDKLDLEYIAGGTIFYDRNDNINAKTMGGLSIPGYFSLNASVNPAAVAESTTGRQVNSLFGRLALSWNNLMYLDVTSREDWVSMLANPEVPKSDRSYNYPSFSGSFIASELLPESTRSWLNLLKIRGSWTQSKTAPSPYSINSVFTVTPNTWNTLSGATAPGALYLNAYSPNSNATSEAGIQGIFLNRRITFDATYYSKRIYDILTLGPLTSASGYSGIYLNTDEERKRRGWEIMLSGTPVKNTNLQWDVSFNWSTHKEVYAKLDSLYSTKKPWIKVGNRTDAYTLQDYLRVPEGEYAGQFIYNSSGRIMRSSYYTLYGYSNPDWIWGANSTLRYKNLSLYVSLDGVVGGLLSTRTESYMWQSGVHPKSVTPERELDVKTPGSMNYLGKGVKVISGTVTFDINGNITSDTRQYAENDIATTYKQAAIDLHSTSAWGGSPNPNDVYSRTFLKMREISLTYTVPKMILSNFGAGVVKEASVSFVGQNVFFWSKDWKYSDPDGGNEDFADPSVRYLGAIIKLSF
ncbi:MAG TPA: SusC/RagA family TonB-linked outer membrane protein [Bacteroidales bacterium]|nr:SusC/RagA family TonB-linked outer membrane protein [Bacteroidales bacterium]HRT88649.1 SusC/RagA family TonB-linked outer membrane protein [Bacteroidales bacterium]